MSDLELITAAEFARLRRCSLRTLDRERATGTGCPYVRLGARVLYRLADVEGYIEAHVRGHEMSADAPQPPELPHRQLGRRQKARVASDRAPGDAGSPEGDARPGSAA